MYKKSAFEMLKGVISTEEDVGASTISNRNAKNRLASFSFVSINPTQYLLVV
jgi:hypothetical protein